MWEHLEKPFVLPTKHAALFRETAAMLSDRVGWERYLEDSSETGIGAFDRLTQGQKQVAILTVSKALLDPAVEMPALIAPLAAAVDAIYWELQGRIEMEIAFAEETTLRQEVLGVMQEKQYWRDVNSSLRPDEEPAVPLSPESDDRAEWGEYVESLRTDVLEDYDFEMEEDFLDLPPVRAAQLKRQMGIRPDYFTSVIEDPVGARRALIRKEIQKLLYS